MKKIIIISAVFVVSLIAGFFIFKGAGSKYTGNAVEVDWRALGELDYITGAKPKSLEDLNGKLVRIPGFMVPLEDNSQKVHEFLLVPSPQACIHVPPPPPNQMVLVKMDEDAQAKVEFGPIWIYGILKIENKKHQYGESTFQMLGQKIEPYQ